MHRGSITKQRSALIGVWVPKAVIPLLDEAVRAEDTDRSKFIRAAIREKLQRKAAAAGVQAR